MGRGLQFGEDWPRTCQDADNCRLMARWIRFADVYGRRWLLLFEVALFWE